MMNSKQRMILILGFVLIAGMLFFPPWLFVCTIPSHDYGGPREFQFGPTGSFGREHVERPAGYHFLFGEHVPQSREQLISLFGLSDRADRDISLSYFALRIDTTRLTVQVMAALFLTGIGFVAFGRKEEGGKS